MSKKIVIIGSGPGGYVAAIRASQLGASVTVVEKGKPGGTCLNVGCIPTKALLHSAEVYTTLCHEARTVGVFADNPRFDWPTVMSRKNEVTSYLVECVGGLLKSNGVDQVAGTGRLIAPNAVEAAGRIFEADAVVVATGSEPAMPPVPGLDLEGVVTSDGALSFDAPPKRFVIVGGGVIGLEFASIFASFGSSVTVVEMLPRILPGIDAEIAGVLQRALAAKGVNFHTGARLNGVTKEANGLRLDISTSAGKELLSLPADKVLVAAGRRPCIRGLGLEALGVETERGRVVADTRMRTNIKSLYAVGDCTGRIQLAHVASREGEVAVENIMGHDVLMDYKTVPSAIYTSPAVASVGLSEEEALKRGYRLRVGRFPMAGNGKSIISGDAEGMVKIIADERYDEILGIHIVGGPATDMIAEGGLALRLEATLDELTTTVHPHPTVSECVLEAALAAWGRPIHLPKAM